MILIAIMKHTTLFKTIIIKNSIFQVDNGHGITCKMFTEMDYQGTTQGTRLFACFTLPSPECPLIPSSTSSCVAGWLQYSRKYLCPGKKEAIERKRAVCWFVFFFFFQEQLNI